MRLHRTTVDHGGRRKGECFRTPHAAGKPGIMAQHLGMQSTGAPPPTLATTQQRSPPGCVALTSFSSVWHSPLGPSQSPGRTLHSRQGCHEPIPDPEQTHCPAGTGAQSR